MSESLTLARPYAKAVFDFAVEHQNIDRWQNFLVFAAEVTKNKKMASVISSRFLSKTIVDIFINICDEKMDINTKNLIQVMAENGRLKLIPDVLKQFKYMRALKEKTSEIELISANPLSDEQITKITQAMEKRLLRKIKPNCKIDKSVVAGIIIRSGDIVIDGSIRNRINRLAIALQT